MDTAPKILNPIEEAMYKKFISQTPGYTVDEWLELRGEALKSSNPAVVKFYKLNNILLEEKPDLDTKRELAKN